MPTPGGVQPAPSTIAPSGAAPTAVRVPPANEDALRVREISALRARFRELQLPSQGAIDAKSSLRIQAALRKRQITLDQVELLMPTYRVLVWHDERPALSVVRVQADPGFAGLAIAGRL